MVAQPQEVASSPGNRSENRHYPLLIEPEIGLQELLSVLRRRIWYVVGLVAPLTLLSLVILTQITPEFTATSAILIEEDSGPAISLDEVVAGLSGDRETVQSEAFVLSSPTLANRVIDKLNLEVDPEFNPYLDLPDGTGSFVDRVIRNFRRPSDPGPGNATGSSGYRSPASGQNSANSQAILGTAVLLQFQDRLDVYPQEGTRVIQLEFRSSRPQLAAVVTNLLAEEYLLSRIEAKFDSTRRASAWLTGRIDELRGEVDQVERNIETLRQQYGLLQGDGLRLSSQELVELNTQLVLARTDRVEAEARLEQIRALIDSPRGVDTAQEVLNSTLIQRLREQQAQVERRVAELSSELGERHPRMIQLRAESADLSESIRAEVIKIVAGLENQVAASRARETSLTASVEELKQRVGESNQHNIEIRALEREAEANRQLLATMLARQKEILSQEDIDFQQADARIISPADLPIEPSYPRTGVVTLLVVVGSLFIALVVVMVVEILDNGFRSGEQIESDTGIVSLGFVPTAPSGKESAYRYFKEMPESAFSEAMKTLTWTLSLVSPGEYPEVILVTSSSASEGKTTTATCLASVLADAGKQVLLMDADLRQPSVHDVMDKRGEPGLVDILAHGKRLERMMQPAEGTLSVLSAGSASPNPTNLLGSAEFERLLDQARQRFDVIIIDSPPVMAGADARVISTYADATLFVVHWSKTRRQTVRYCLRQLDAAGAKIVGAFLTLVDTRKHRHYGYGDSDAYSGAMAKYYAG